jgi:hypothetical protein
MMLSIFCGRSLVYTRFRPIRVIHSDHAAGGIWIALLVVEATNMEAKETTIRKTPCSSPPPELEVPMINTMVACLGVQHRKLNDLDTQLAFAASRLAGDSGAVTASQQALLV